MNIETGRVYRAKKPSVAGGCYVNDRQVTWTSDTRVQYDSPSVRRGSSYPTIDREAFEKWAGSDITGTLPDGDWADWIDYQRSKRKSA